MAQHRAVADRPLGGMQPPAHSPRRVARDRARPRRRPSAARVPRRAAPHPVVAQRAVGACRCGCRRSSSSALAVWWGNPVGYVLAFLLMGRAHAQLASLMHEAAHRLLFAEPARQRLRRPVAARVPDRSRRPTRTAACTWPTTARSSGPTSPTSRCTRATRSARPASGASWCATRPVAPGSSCSASSSPGSARPTPRCVARSGRSCSCRRCCSAPRSRRRVVGVPACSGCCRT